MSKGKDFSEFSAFLADVFSQSELHDDQMDLLTIPLWDSMAQLVIAAWIHQQTGHLVNIHEIKAAKTVGDLNAIYASKISC
jgi:hypothetical protein